MKTMLPMAVCALFLVCLWPVLPEFSSVPLVLAQEETVDEGSPSTQTPDDQAADTPESATGEEKVDEAVPDAGGEADEPSTAAETVASLADEDNNCIECHGNSELWEGDTLHLLVTPQMLAADIHWQKGIKCQECHGGDASTLDLRQAHALEDGFRKIDSPADVVKFCGHCHADKEYMHRFQPDAPLDIIDRFLASVHGKGLMPPASGVAKSPDAAASGDAAENRAAAEPSDVPESGEVSESGEDSAGEEEGADVAQSNAIDLASCIACHLPHQMRPVSDPLSAIHPGNLAVTCGACHRNELVGLRMSVHAKAGEKDSQGAGMLMDCGKCHGLDVHGMLPVSDPASPVRLEQQVQHCGDCHESYRATYMASVHGQGLTRSGLVWSAVCADCHGAHAIFYAADRRSTLHTTKVGATCGKCHHFLLERLAASVHGSGDDAGSASGLGGASEHAAPGGTIKRRPTCTDCHQGHDALVPHTEGFRRALPNRCGNCHADLADRYRLSLHGELTEFGYEPAAECADCHGAHDIMPLSNPASRLGLTNRVATCQRCHPNANVNFAKFDPHASYKDATSYPLLHGLVSWLETIIYVLVGLFVLHMLFWFTRSYLHARRFGRDRTCVAGRPAIRAFVDVNRVIYKLLMVAFVGLVLTGLPLKYGAYPWAKRVAEMIGGFPTTSVWHHAFATLLLVSALVHLRWAVGWVWRRRRSGLGWGAVFLGPDSAVPNRRDLHDLLGMFKWFIGLGNKPRFERWAYWEKFDYWGVYAAAGLIGLSGLMLWFPHIFCLFLPGTVLNIAKVVHGEIALAAAGFVFMIHVFNTHLRPEKFPLDASWFTGVVSEEHLGRSRPDFLRRMRDEGKLDALRTEAPPAARLRSIRVGAFLLLATAMCVLAIIVVVSLGK